MFPGIPAEQVATTAANTLLNNLEHGGCVDEYMQDQVSASFHRIPTFGPLNPLISRSSFS